MILCLLYVSLEGGENKKPTGTECPVGCRWSAPRLLTYYLWSADRVKLRADCNTPLGDAITPSLCRYRL